MGIWDTHQGFPSDIGSDQEAVEEGYGKDSGKRERGR